MDYEKRQLESLKYDLTAVNDYYLRLNRALEMDPDNEVLKKKVENRKMEMDKKKKKITNLESLIELENNYTGKADELKKVIPDYLVSAIEYATKG